MLHKKDLSRIKEVLYCAKENKPLTRDDIVMGAAVNNGEYVVVTEQELKQIAPPTASTMDILQFVAAGDVDPLYFESSYYLAPEESVSKPYVLLLQAMSDTKRCAVAKITMHGREHIAIIRPAHGALVLHTMYFVDELQKANVPSIPKAKAIRHERDRTGEDPGEQARRAVQAGAVPRRVSGKRRAPARTEAAGTEGDRGEAPQGSAGGEYHGGIAEEPERIAQGGRGETRAEAAGTQVDSRLNSNVRSDVR